MVTNWAGNHTYGATRSHEPESVEELQDIVRAGRSLKALGSRHSFNDIADTTGDHISLDRMPRRFELDRAAGTVTVDGAVRYGQLAGPLDAAGFALHNLASLPHISVAGASATATHGSGDRTGNLATAVSALEVVQADGELVRIDGEGDPNTLNGAVVSLGGIGVVTALTLRLQPTFDMRQDLYEDLALVQVVEHFDEISATADSVSLFTGWLAPAFEQVWLKRRVVEDEPFEPPQDFFGATRATAPLHPIRGASVAAVTEQLGVPGPWHARMPHFRMGHTPSSGDELQTEYLIPRRHAAEALLAVAALGDRIGPLLQISEVRTVASDDLWMSTAQGRPSVAIHFTWKPDWEAVRGLLPGIETALAPFEPRPHWGKLFTMSPDALRSRYQHLSRYVEMVERYDPSGKFRNPFLDRFVFAR